MSALLSDAVRAQIGARVRYRAPEVLGRASIRHFAMAIGADLADEQPHSQGDLPLPLQLRVAQRPPQLRRVVPDPPLEVGQGDPDPAQPQTGLGLAERLRRLPLLEANPLR